MLILKISCADTVDPLPHPTFNLYLNKIISQQLVMLFSYNVFINISDSLRVQQFVKFKKINICLTNYNNIMYTYEYNIYSTFQ